MPTVRLELPRPHPGQQEIMSRLSRFNVAVCGRRFGKSTLALQRLLPALHGYPVAYFAPTYKMLEEFWREVNLIFAAITRRRDTQQHRLELVTGGVIDMWSLDNADGPRGRKYAHVIIDEAALVRRLEEAWQAAIRPTLTDYAGSADFLSTPKGENYFKVLFDLATKDDDWASFQQPTSSNPHIDPAEIEAARRQLPSVVFRQEYEAEFVTAEGTAVKRQWLRYGEPPEGLRVSMGVDLAISTKTSADYTAAVVLGQQGGKVYVVEAARTRASFHEVLSFIVSLAEKWRPAIIAIEQVQYQAAVVQELLRTTRLPVRGVVPDRDKLTRFQPLAARYEQGLVVHSRHLDPAFEHELLSFPLGEHDDLVDAAAHSYAAPVGSSWEVAAAAAG